MSRVEGFIMEALGGSRKRPAHTSGIGATLLLPASVTLEYGDVVKDVVGDGAVCLLCVWLPCCLFADSALYLIFY